MIPLSLLEIVRFWAASASSLTLSVAFSQELCLAQLKAISPTRLFELVDGSLLSGVVHHDSNFFFRQRLLEVKDEIRVIGVEHEPRLAHCHYSHDTVVPGQKVRG